MPPRRTENGAPLRGDGWVVEKMDEPPNLDRRNAARLSQRTRRTTKIHKARRSLEHRGTQRVTQRNTGMDCLCILEITKNTKDHNGAQRGWHGAEGGPCVRTRHTSGPGPGGHGGLRTPCFGGRGADAPRRTENGKRRTESARQARDGEAAVRERRWSPSSGPTASLVRRFRRFRRFRSAPVGRRVETARREADGREGAISGRLARRVTGVSPSDFARTRVFAGKRPAGFPWAGLQRCRRA